MKLYIVTETNCESNNLLRTWVCFTEDEAKVCLKKRYEIACSYCHIGGLDVPTDCLDLGFFYWNLQDGQQLRYNIVESNTFAE